MAARILKPGEAAFAAGDEDAGKSTLMRERLLSRENAPVLLAYDPVGELELNFDGLVVTNVKDFGAALDTAAKLARNNKTNSFRIALVDQSGTLVAAFIKAAEAFAKRVGSQDASGKTSGWVVVVWIEDAGVVLSKFDRPAKSNLGRILRARRHIGAQMIIVVTTQSASDLPVEFRKRFSVLILFRQAADEDVKYIKGRFPFGDMTWRRIPNLETGEHIEVRRGIVKIHRPIKIGRAA